MEYLDQTPDRPSVTVTDGDWTLTTNTNSTPNIRLRNRQWGANEFQGTSPHHVARTLKILRLAAEAKAGTTLGGGSYPIPTGEIETVLAMLERVLPEWLAGITRDDWRGMSARDRVTTHALLARYGVDPAVLYPEDTN